MFLYNVSSSRSTHARSHRRAGKGLYLSSDIVETSSQFDAFNARSMCCSYVSNISFACTKLHVWHAQGVM